MLKEIGGEFWDVPTGARNHLFPESAQWYLSGRSALNAIAWELKDCRTVAMPAWCCESMIKPFVDAGLAVRFYPVWFDGVLRQELRYDCDALFVIDYFGYSASASDALGYSGVIIRDVTHSLFSTVYHDASYYFGSLRKWCGIWTGGYAWTGDGHALPNGMGHGREYAALRRLAMERKEAYLRRNTGDKGYLEIFEKAENLLEESAMLPADGRDVDLANRLDVDLIRRRRRANAVVLRQAFPSWLVFPEMKLADCPMFVPVIVPGNQRSGLRKYLIDHSVYCPVHWPVSEYHWLDERERFIYDNELSLVCDQRYTPSDMNRMVDTIKQFMEA